MRPFTFVLLAAGSTAACSSISATQACADLTQAVCAKLAQCASPIVTGLYGDTTTCGTRSNVTCESGLALKNTGDTPDQAEKCSKAYATLSCTDALGNNPPADCKPSSPGKVADGSGCGTAGQCMSGVCQIDPKTGCGTCIEPVASGQPCKAASDCQTGLVCAPSSMTTAVCIAPAALNATCSDTLPIVPCQAGLVCGAGKCQTPLPSGAACNPQTPLCDGAGGDWCTPLGTRCQPVLYASVGQPCGYNTKTGDLTNCSASGFCANVDPKTLMGMCAAAAGDGNACDVAKGPLCEPPAFCNTSGDPDGGTNGTCTIVDPSTCH